jgi:hypothetical protein
MPAAADAPPVLVACGAYWLRVRRPDRLAGEALRLLDGGSAQASHCRSTKMGPNRPRAALSETYAPRNPNGYCGLGGTGVSCPIGLTQSS